MVIDHNMFTLYDILSLIISGILSCVALLPNGFLIVVNSHRWLQTRKLVPCDLLLTFLETFRFVILWLFLIEQCIYTSSPVTYKNGSASEIMIVLWMYFTVANYSSLTSLTVFYCVKVTSFGHPLFLWMKSRIDSLVPTMLTMPLLIYMVIYLPSIVTILSTEKCCHRTGNLTEKKVYSKMAREYFYAVAYPLYLSFIAISFSICLTASFLLLFSLWRHTRNLKKNGIGIKDLSTQVHISVIIPQLLSLFLYILHFVLMTNVLIQVFEFGNTRQLIADTILNSCSSAHSVILILTNPKLKGACARILRIRGGFTSKKSQESRLCS